MMGCAAAEEETKAVAETTPDQSDQSDGADVADKK